MIHVAFWIMVSLWTLTGIGRVVIAIYELRPKKENSNG